MNTRHSSEPGSAVAPPPLAWVAALMGWMGEAFRLSERSVGPVVDLFIRLRLAQIFFVSGVLKAADFEHAIYLSTHEYPVSWMDPVTAAYLGVAIELGGSVLLAVGLATRLAAVAAIQRCGFRPMFTLTMTGMSAITSCKGCGKQTG